MNGVAKMEPSAVAAEQLGAAGGTSISRRRLIIGHVSVSVAFLVIYILLDRPDVILMRDRGFTAWYPPVGLAMALLLGISPWYAPLVWLSGTLAGALLYHQPIVSWSGTLGALCTAGLYAL